MDVEFPSRSTSPVPTKTIRSRHSRLLMLCRAFRESVDVRWVGEVWSCFSLPCRIPKIGSGSGGNGWFRCHELTSGGGQCCHDDLRTVKGTSNRKILTDRALPQGCRRFGNNEAPAQLLLNHDFTNFAVPALPGRRSECNRLLLVLRAPFSLAQFAHWEAARCKSHMHRYSRRAEQSALWRHSKCTRCRNSEDNGCNGYGAIPHSTLLEKWSLSACF